MSNNIQDLQKELQNLRNILTSENYEEIRRKMKLIDNKITALRKEALLKGVNSNQKRLRDFALQAWEAEQPKEDITTNDGSFHKVKVKKYPKLEAMKYTTGIFKDGLLITLIINGEKFSMYRTEYNAVEPEKHTRPNSFEDFLKLNNISKEDITLTQFEEISNKIKEQNEKMQKYIEDYKKEMEAINAYNLECWKLISRRAEYLYLYNTNQ